MENFKELFFLFKKVIEELIDRKIEYDEFMAIYPKLLLIDNYLDLTGSEVVDLIDMLLLFKEKNYLDLINSETIELVNMIYDSQRMVSSYMVLDKPRIFKDLLLPYNINKCKEVSELYEHMKGFELLFVFLRAILLFNPMMFNKIRKYNSELYELIYNYEKNVDKVRETNDQLISVSSIHLYSLFYFKQNDYGNDYSLLDETINIITEKSDYFLEYCEEEGISIGLNTIYSFFPTFTGLAKLLDEIYKEKKVKKREL